MLEKQSRKEFKAILCQVEGDIDALEEAYTSKERLIGRRFKKERDTIFDKPIPKGERK